MYKQLMLKKMQIFKRQHTENKKNDKNAKKRG